MTMHEVNGDRDPESHFPEAIQTEEARTIWRVLLNLGSSLGAHATRVDQRFDGLETTLKNFIAGVRLELESRRGGKPPSLPPMRPESPSSLILLEQVKAEALETLRARAAQTPGSHVQAEPEDLAADVEALVAKALEAREHASNARFLKWQRGVAAAGVVAFVTAICGAAGLWAWGKAQHAEGFVEGKSHPAAGAGPAR